MMNKFKLSVLTIFLLSISLPRIQAQTNVRAYEKWEATQFVAVSGHQPEDYVLADNNWEIIYNLRTPHTLNERLSGNIWLVSFKISYLCLPLFYETRTTPSCHPSGCAYRQL